MTPEEFNVWSLKISKQCNEKAFQELGFSPQATRHMLRFVEAIIEAKLPTPQSGFSFLGHAGNPDFFRCIFGSDEFEIVLQLASPIHDAGFEVELQSAIRRRITKDSETQAYEAGEMIRKGDTVIVDGNKAKIYRATPSVDTDESKLVGYVPDDTDGE